MFSNDPSEETSLTVQEVSNCCPKASPSIGYGRHRTDDTNVGMNSRRVLRQHVNYVLSLTVRILVVQLAEAIPVDWLVIPSLFNVNKSYIYNFLAKCRHNEGSGSTVVYCKLPKHEAVGFTKF